MSGIDKEEKDEIRKDLREKMRKDFESGRRPRTSSTEVGEFYPDSYPKELKDAFSRQEELMQGLIHESKKQTKLLEEIRDSLRSQGNGEGQQKVGEKHE